jgi:hypothetical protein
MRWEDDDPEYDDWTPDPRDLAEHLDRVAEIDQCRCQRRDYQRRIPIEVIPTDDAPVASLEPFGFDGEYVMHIGDQIGTVGHAREVIAEGLDICRMGDIGRRLLAETLARADRWLSANPTHLV